MKRYLWPFVILFAVSLLGCSQSDPSTATIAASGEKQEETPAQAAAVILDGVRNEQWRILVGEDAKFLDEIVRENPETAYEVSFVELMDKEREKRGAENILEALKPKEE